MSVAAAASINIVTANAIAKLADNQTITTSGGAVSLHTSSDADATAKAKATAVKAKTANIGAAVALNLVHVTNEASLGVDAVVSSNGLDLVAAMRSSGGANGKHELDAEATSGAGGGKVGIAGSLALTIADIETNAVIHSNAGRGPPGHDLHGQDLTLSATAVVESTDKAMAKDDDAGTVGIGAGAAINIVDDTTAALLDSGAALTGVKDVSLSATSTDTLTTYAEAGADGAGRLDARLHRRRRDHAGHGHDDGEARRHLVADADDERRRDADRDADREDDDEGEGDAAGGTRRDRPRAGARDRRRLGHGRHRPERERRRRGQLQRDRLVGEHDGGDRRARRAPRARRTRRTAARTTRTRT